MDKGIEMIKKVKADIRVCKEIVRETNCINMMQIAALRLKENERWLAEWDLQNKVAMRNNCKK